MRRHPVRVRASALGVAQRIERPRLVHQRVDTTVTGAYGRRGTQGEVAGSSPAALTIYSPGSGRPRSASAGTVQTVFFRPQPGQVRETARTTVNVPSSPASSSTMVTPIGASGAGGVGAIVHCLHAIGGIGTPVRHAFVVKWQPRAVQVRVRGDPRGGSTPSERTQLVHTVAKRQMRRRGPAGVLMGVGVRLPPDSTRRPCRGASIHPTRRGGGGETAEPGNDRDAHDDQDRDEGGRFRRPRERPWPLRFESGLPTNGVIAQAVERPARNGKVRGSTPRCSTRGDSNPGHAGVGELESPPPCQGGDHGFKSRRRCARSRGREAKCAALLARSG